VACGWLLFTVLICWSVACAVAIRRGFGRRLAWVVAEIVVVVALVLTTELVASAQWALDTQSWPTTLWGHQRNDLRGDPDGSPGMLPVWR
jgi:hypothetical protein